MTPEKNPGSNKINAKTETQVKKLDNCLDSAFASLADKQIREGQFSVKDDKIKLINGDYNDLLDREMPKVAYEKACTKYTASPYSKGNSTHPSSTNTKSPLNEYADSYDYPPTLGGIASKLVTSGSSQRSSFDDSINHTLNQSDHYCAKDRHSGSVMTNEEVSPKLSNSCDKSSLMMKLQDSDEQLSSEEETLMA